MQAPEPPFYLRIRDLSSKNANYFLQVRWHATVKDVKDQIHRITSIPPSSQLLFLPSNSKPLRNQLTLNDLSVETTGSVLYLLSAESTSDDFFVISEVGTIWSDDCDEMLSAVRAGLERGQKPKAIEKFESTGGVYFMKGSNGATVAIFKPGDEEQGMPNNPHDFVGKGLAKDSLRQGFLPGYGYMREVAAYMMDVGGVSSVPATMVIDCHHPMFSYRSNHNHHQDKTSSHLIPKLGSLQRYVHSLGTFEDYGYSVFSDFEVQKIALFDMRILNNDRHSGNILVRRRLRRPRVNIDSSSTCSSTTRCRRSSSLSSQSSIDNANCEDMCFEMEDDMFDSNNSGNQSNHHSNNRCDQYLELVPIDHGYCFPSELKIHRDHWSWINCPQIKRPINSELLTYMRSINIDELIATLGESVDDSSSVRLDDRSLFLLRVSHLLIVESLIRGLTIFEIAQLIARESGSEYDFVDENDVDAMDDKPSPLETVVTAAEYNALRILDMKYHFEAHHPSSALGTYPSTPGPRVAARGTFPFPNTSKGGPEQGTLKVSPLTLDTLQGGLQGPDNCHDHIPDLLSPCNSDSLLLKTENNKSDNKNIINNTTNNTNNTNSSNNSSSDNNANNNGFSSAATSPEARTPLRLSLLELDLEGDYLEAGQGVYASPSPQANPNPNLITSPNDTLVVHDRHACEVGGLRLTMTSTGNTGNTGSSGNSGSSGSDRCPSHSQVSCDTDSDESERDPSDATTTKVNDPPKVPGDLEGTGSSDQSVPVVPMTRVSSFAAFSSSPVNRPARAARAGLVAALASYSGIDVKRELERLKLDLCRDGIVNLVNKTIRAKGGL